MALLGKTLKGRSTRPGGIPVMPNIKWRQLIKNQDDFDQFKRLSKLKLDELRFRIKSEYQIASINKKKLLTYWRKILRMAKTEQLRN